MKKLEIGTRVFDIRWGWGAIVEYREDFNEISYPIIVRFDGKGISTYTLSGVHSMGDSSPLLSLTEYSLENGGFTDISEWGKPKVGDFGYFWHYETKDFVFYSKLIGIDSSSTYKYTMADSTGWTYFSKEVPGWFLDKMNKQI